MRSQRQIRRDAKRLFRLCLVRGWLDEARVRKAVQKVLEANRVRCGREDVGHKPFRDAGASEAFQTTDKSPPSLFDLQ